MSANLADSGRLVSAVRTTLAISGAVALIAGIVLLVWPEKSAMVITGIFATYLLIAGVVYIVLGVFSGQSGGWARVGHIALGLLFIVAAIVAFANLSEATAALALIVVIFIGVSWIVDGVVALSLLGRDGSRVWTLLYALLSIIGGIVVLFSPAFAAAVLWWILGVILVVLGVVQIVRALTLGKGTTEAAAPHHAAA